MLGQAREATSAMPPAWTSGRLIKLGAPLPY
jgi:hypothetical protein